MGSVRVAAEGSLVIVTLDRPPVNAVDLAMYGEIRDTFNGLREAFPDGRVVVLDAAGRHFCGGNDIGDFETMTSSNAPQRMQGVREAFWAIHDCPLPVVAAVHGSALGTGLAIAASADLIVAAEDAVFGLPELSVGAMGGARHLARLVPQQLMRHMVYTCEPVAARDLLKFGTVLDVVPADQLRDRAREIAAKIAGKHPEILRLAKQSLNGIDPVDIRRSYRYEQGFTFELNLTGVSDQARQVFLDGR